MTQFVENDTSKLNVNIGTIDDVQLFFNSQSYIVKNIQI